MEVSENTIEATRQENVSRILDAAERLFKHYGYTKTNVADIARDLGMSPANIYRFFSSKADIHQALANRMLDGSYQMAVANAKRPVSATERLHDHVLQQHRLTLETMLDEKKVHEMVVIAIEQQWPVIQQHLDRLRLLIADLIREGIDAGEFREQNPLLAAENFMSCMVKLCHPMLIADCLLERQIGQPEDLVEFGLRALK
ncbi:AcrR family transcriptional regulator [Rhizobium petrolearium]|uniref:TetR/AcrR family transcriptional regulator n=1 Tax=Neorhizobium petrolearium TaxID=515361 RepID=UPI001AE30485|nr:TetR/AcrR family transcriptional regulator [Neorhizobium petrolearium]MBP1842616.1 AcrR family transcriptional regulator [Neorhizobium petrolearium]